MPKEVEHPFSQNFPKNLGILWHRDRDLPVDEVEHPFFQNFPKNLGIPWHRDRDLPVDVVLEHPDVVLAYPKGEPVSFGPQSIDSKTESYCVQLSNFISKRNYIYCIVELLHIVFMLEFKSPLSLINAIQA